MRAWSMLGVVMAMAMAGCAGREVRRVAIDGIALGRVLIYGDGVAFYERRVRVTDGALTVKVPLDRLDAFVKSLTVVDARTAKPLAVSLPRRRAGAAYAEATFDVPREETDVVMTYVTTGTWKPSYRVVVGDRGKVMIEGWALVENRSGEAWTEVLIGVGTSEVGRRVRDDPWAIATGEAVFLSMQPTTVADGASAMVAVVRAETEGEPAYLYDLDGDGSDARYAFKAVRLRNPTDAMIERGPVTIYGNERFLGEGTVEAVAPRANAVVPFALDRQITVAREDGMEEEVVRLTAPRAGVLTAELRRIETIRLTVASALRTATKVYVRHTIANGKVLLDGAPAFERRGDAVLFEIALAPGATRTVEIREATSLDRTVELWTPGTAAPRAPGIVVAVQAFVDAVEAVSRWSRDGDDPSRSVEPPTDRRQIRAGGATRAR